jgi:hypothetical protein
MVDVKIKQWLLLFELIHTPTQLSAGGWSLYADTCEPVVSYMANKFNKKKVGLQSKTNPTLKSFKLLDTNSTTKLLRPTELIKKKKNFIKEKNKDRKQRKDGYQENYNNKKKDIKKNVQLVSL